MAGVNRALGAVGEWLVELILAAFTTFLQFVLIASIIVFILAFLVIVFEPRVAGVQGSEFSRIAGQSTSMERESVGGFSCRFRSNRVAELDSNNKPAQARAANIQKFIGTS